MLFPIKRFNLETAVRDGKLMQDLELESLCNGAGHSQVVKDHPIANDSGSRDCVKLPSPTAVFRIIHIFSIAAAAALILFRFYPTFHVASFRFMRGCCTESGCRRWSRQ